MFLNADLIESIEARPDTVVTLVDGRKTVVAESPEEVVDRIRLFRAAVLAAVDDMRAQGGTPGAPGNSSLVLLRNDED